MGESMGVAGEAALPANEPSLGRHLDCLGSSALVHLPNVVFCLPWPDFAVISLFGGGGCCCCFGFCV